MLSTWIALLLLLVAAVAAPSPAGPPGAGPLAGVASRPDRPGEWAVVDASGRVWWTGDAGGDWVEVLAPIPADAGAVGPAAELAARIAELREAPAPVAVPLDDREAVDDLDAIRADAEDAAAAARDAALGALWTEVDAGGGLAGAERPPGRVRPTVTFTGADLAVTRADGLWIGGAHRPFVRVLSGPVTAFCARAGRWFAGTPAGPRSALAGTGGWSAPDPTPGAVRGLSCAGAVATATDRGVWDGTVDGTRWVRRAGAIEAGAVHGRVVAGEGRLWAGVPPRPVRSAPGVTSIVATASGDLFALGAAGGWVSGDGGRTWAPAAGLPASPIRAAAADRDRLLLATDAGLRVLDLPGPEAGGDGAARPAAPPGPPAWAPTRDPASRAARRGRWAGWLPSVDLVAAVRRDRGAGRDAGSDASGWGAAIALTWVPRRQAALEEVDVVVVDGEVVIDDGEAPHVLAARLARSAFGRRARAARAMSELLDARRVAAAHLEALGADPLLPRIRAALRLAEIDARLDLLAGAAGAAAGREDR